MKELESILKIVEEGLRTLAKGVTAIADKLDDIGLAIDFRELKGALKPLIKMLDHSCLNQLPVFEKQNPSSENIARWLYNELKQNPALAKVRLRLIRVWESDTASAAYFEGGGG